MSAVTYPLPSVSAGRHKGGKSRPLGIQSDMIEYLARCHCGTVQARYRTALAPSVWSLRACQCSFCRRHGAITTSDPAGLIGYECSQGEQLQRYRFGSRNTEFLICRNCGVYLGAQMRANSGRYGILNVLTLAAFPTDLPPPEPMNYENESPEARRRRRETRWTPVANESL